MTELILTSHQHMNKTNYFAHEGRSIYVDNDVQLKPKRPRNK